MALSSRRKGSGPSSEDELAGCLDESSSENFKSNNLFEFNTPPGLWKREKGIKVRSPKARELFVLKDYLLGLSLIFWVLFLI